MTGAERRWGLPVASCRHRGSARCRPRRSCDSRAGRFSAFTPENDPHGEHDFGAFDHKGDTIYWKIDDYDPTLTHGSEDPSDARQTRRVLTIMLASEW